jgi:hypothetical protein
MHRIFSFWIGDALGDYDRLCLASWRALGHPVTIYAYAALAGVPPGVDVADAAAIVPKETLFDRAPGISHAMRADVFRMAGIAAGCGVWCDTDVLLLRPLPQFRDVLVGRERGGHLCNAVLGARTDLPMMRAVVDAFVALRAPSWGRPKLLVRRALRRFRGAAADASDYPMHTWGRHALAHFVDGAALRDQALPQTAFYHPIAYGDAAFADPASAALEDDPAVIGLHCFSRARSLYARVEPASLVGRARTRLEGRR